jgi:hypothetical protein
MLFEKAISLANVHPHFYVKTRKKYIHRTRDSRKRESSKNGSSVLLFQFIFDR